MPSESQQPAHYSGKLLAANQNRQVGDRPVKNRGAEGLGLPSIRATPADDKAGLFSARSKLSGG